VSIVAPVVGWALSLAFGFTLFRVWKAPSEDRSYQRPAWWLWSERSWRGYRRGVLAAALVIFSFTLALTLRGAAGLYAGLAGMFVFFPLMVTIALFNWPKFLVPPASRGDAGLVSEWSRNREAKKGS